ncbi:MAG TPA: hypothetical protein VEB21_09655 [Terriglobales bacterium]|nr:hypothetical protein [Terriglobales bacterium]
MTKEQAELDRHAPLSAASAFVVHVTGGGRHLAEDLHGRVEHVTSC